MKKIIIKGARENNLKNIDVEIPRDKLVVITGISGSGKSSLAFDTIYAEGQRRYVESLSAYARQFLGRMEKPDVEYIEGLSPAISIDQKGVSHNPRSTVGTITEIYDYLRLLFARVGHPHCHKCGRPVDRQTVQQIVDSIASLPRNSRVMIMSPIVRDRKGEYLEVFEDMRKKGFARVRVDGHIHELSEDIPPLGRYKSHNIEVVVDRLVIEPTLDKTRVADSIEASMKLASGSIMVNISDTDEDIIYSDQFACVYCNISLGETEPRNFSFNNPHGACKECVGLGFKMEVDPDLVMPDKDLSLSEGAIVPWSRDGSMSPWHTSRLLSLAKAEGFSTQIPVHKLSEDVISTIMHGNKGKRFDMKHRTKRGKVFSWRTTFEGVVNNLSRRYKDTESDRVRYEVEKYMSRRPCPGCDGKRLKAESLAVTVANRNISDVSAMSINDSLDWVSVIDKGELPETETVGRLTDKERYIARQINKEICSRLRFLKDIGLDYLTLDRMAQTLSGGEAQRIRLATQIGSGLVGVLYVCDEPSIGLHAADNSRLIETLKRLRDLGNTVILVEHDEAIMRAADYIVDLGPGAGTNGGYLVAAGTIQDIVGSSESITGAYLSGLRAIETPAKRRSGNGTHLTIKKARENNLKDINVRIPLGKLVCVTGVSGSGKSSLVDEILYKNLAQVLYRAKEKPGDHAGITGIGNIDKVVKIDQSPIGRTPRSNPATYVGAFTPIREIFARMPASKARGYKLGRFSFNVKGGRCEACSGDGYIEIEMQFLPDVTVPCEVCKGKRYNREAMEIHFKDKNIADILDMTVDEALDFFANIPSVRTRLETMHDVGLGYIKLGQPATTLSGGEAQRVKLSTELSRKSTGKTLYVLDEPTTGLSFSDCDALLRVLHRLVDGGNTVILIEHHLDMIKNADWIIDLGPGAGNEGGYLIAQGTPEKVAQVADSLTGQYLRTIVNDPVKKKMSKVTS